MLNRIGLRARSWSSIAALCIVSACGITLSPDDFARQPTVTDVCYAVALSHPPNGTDAGLDAGIAELRKRTDLSEADLAVIRTGRIFIGMSEDALLCVLAGQHPHINETITAGGVMRQYVLTGGRYVYTENGIVTALQS